MAGFYVTWASKGNTRHNLFFTLQFTESIIYGTPVNSVELKTSARITPFYVSPLG
jgi:hypothetical protein